MKRTKLEDTSYWPGYVDALVNVVLNILFLVGLMAVGLVSLNVEALGNFKMAGQAKQLQKINEDNLMLAALGTLLAALPEPPKSTPADSRPPVAKLPEPPRVEPRPAPAAPVAAAPVAAAPAAAAPPQAQPTVLRVGQPFVTVPSAQEDAFLQTKLSVGTAPKVMEFQGLQYLLTPAQIKEVQSLAEANSAAKWSLLATVPAQDERLGREAFWRLTSVREKLVAAGIKPEAIALRTVTQENTNFSNGRRVFVYARSGNVAN
jgi:hypothetical protein